MEKEKCSIETVSAELQLQSEDWLNFWNCFIQIWSLEFFYVLHSSSSPPKKINCWFVVVLHLGCYEVRHNTHQAGCWNIININLIPKFLNDSNNLKERRANCVIREVLWWWGLGPPPLIHSFHIFCFEMERKPRGLRAERCRETLHELWCSSYKSFMTPTSHQWCSKHVHYILFIFLIVHPKEVYFYILLPGLSSMEYYTYM